MPRVTVGAAGESCLVDYMPQKRAGGLVCVDPTKLVNVTRYGLDRIVIKAPWRLLEPSQGTYVWDAVDSVMAANPTAKVTLRFLVGEDAPQWLKDATGTLDLYNASRKIWVKACKWWTPAARNAWQALVAAAGARYDSNPRVVLVSACLGMVAFAEPLILGGDDPSAIALFGAGLTQALMVDTISWCVDVTAAAFPGTFVELALHSELQYPTATGCGRSWEAARALANAIGAKHGTHVAFTDYGLGIGDTLAANTPAAGETLANARSLYVWMYLYALAGGVTGFQLTPNGNTTAADYELMARNGLALLAWWVETSGWGNVAGATLTSIDTQLKARFILAA